MAEARSMLIFGETDTGLAIGDLTFNFIKTIEDGTTVSATGSTLVELGRGFYTLMNPNIVEDTLFSVYITADSTKVCEGIFTLYADIAVAVRDVDNSAPAAGSLGEDVYRAKIGSNSYLPNLYIQQGQELTSVVCAARWSGGGSLELWGYSDNAGYGDGILLGTISGDGTYLSNGATSAGSSSLGFEWSGSAPTGVTLGDLTITGPTTGAIYVWRALDPAVLQIAGNGILGVDGSIYNWPSFDGLAMISPAPSVDPFVRNKLNSLPLTMLNRFVTATSWVKADFTATTTSVITGDALLEVWGYNLVESTSEPNIGGYILGQAIMLGSFDSTGVWTFGVDWTEPSISRDIIEIYAGGGSTGSISAGKLTISTKRYGNPDNNYEVFVTKVPAVSTGGGDGGYIMVDGSLSYQTGTGTRFASVSQAVLDTTSIAEAVRDVDNSAPAAGSLGASANGGLASYEMGRVIGMQLLGNELLALSAVTQIDLAFSGTITGTGSFVVRTEEITADATASPNSGKISLSEGGTLIGTYDSTGWHPESIGTLYKPNIFFRINSSDGVSSGIFTFTITDGMGQLEYKVPYDNTGTDFYIWLGGDGKLIGYGGSGPQSSLHQPVRLPTYPEADTEAIAVAVRDVSNTSPAADSLGADLKATKGQLATVQQLMSEKYYEVGSWEGGNANVLTVTFDGVLDANGYINLTAWNAYGYTGSPYIYLGDYIQGVGWTKYGSWNTRLNQYVLGLQVDGVTTAGTLHITINDSYVGVVPRTIDIDLPLVGVGRGNEFMPCTDGTLLMFGRTETQVISTPQVIAEAVRDVDNSAPASGSLGETANEASAAANKAFGMARAVGGHVIGNQLLALAGVTQVTASYSGTITGDAGIEFHIVTITADATSGTSAWITLNENGPLIGKLTAGNVWTEEPHGTIWASGLFIGTIPASGTISGGTLTVTITDAIGTTSVDIEIQEANDFKIWFGADGRFLSYGGEVLGNTQHQAIRPPTHPQVDTTAVAEAVRDVNNTAPAANSLGEAINDVFAGTQMSLFNAYGWHVTAGSPSTGSFDQTLPVGAVMYFSIRNSAGQSISFGDYNGTWTSYNIDTWGDEASTIILEVDFEIGDTIPAGTFTITIPETIVGGETGASRTFTLQIPTIYGIQDGSWEHTPRVLFRADGSPFANAATGADPGAIAIAVRDVDNTSPANNSLGKAVNDTATTQELSDMTAILRQTLAERFYECGSWDGTQSDVVSVSFSGVFDTGGYITLHAWNILQGGVAPINLGTLNSSNVWSKAAWTTLWYHLLGLEIYNVLTPGDLTITVNHATWGVVPRTITIPIPRYADVNYQFPPADGGEPIMYGRTKKAPKGGGFAVGA